ncbi:NAD(P)-binding protein [Fomitopsis betulina]|nr:NAD(P)-binding protein [Fomitopsis betulina]
MYLLNELWGRWRVVAETFFMPKPTFSTDQIPDLSGQVFIVTGGNAGIGKETIRVLLQHDAKVYLAARSRERAETAIEDLKKQTGKEAIFLELDLTSFQSIRSAAEGFLSKESALHVLINNAGVMLCPVEWVTADGYDLQFMTNVLGPFLFTKLLMPAILAGAETHPDHHSRIIEISSSASHLCSDIKLDTFKDGPERRRLSPIEHYSQSKLANFVIARQYAKRYADRGVVSIALNPGNIDTDLLKNFPRITHRLMRAIMLHPIQYGGLTQLYASTMPEAIHHNGGFLIPWARVGSARPEAYDDALGERLYAWLENEVKDK